ncbi:hypothetical protein BW28_06045 [Clostridioides difficile]|nr:hypothetical protein BW28_06045 [Clostridioides difficile]
MNTSLTIFVYLAMWQTAVSRRPPNPGSIEEVLIIVREIILRTGLAAERLAVTHLLEIVQTAGDTLVAIGVKRIEIDAGAAVHTGIHLGVVEDRLSVRIHDAGSRAGVGVHEEGIGIRLIVGTFQIAVTQGSLKNRERGDGLAVALELGFTLLVGCLDSRLDLLDGLGIGLRDDEAHAELRRAAVDALRLPDIRIAPSGVGTSDNLGGIYKIL